MIMATLARNHLAWAYQNAWANHRLLRACGQLDQEDFVAKRTSFFPSIKATLNHILTVDWYYVDSLERSLHGLPHNEAARRFFDPEEPFDRCAELAFAQRESDRRLIELCRSLDDEGLQQITAIPRSKSVVHEPTWRVLAHLFEHQIHHRGQVHAMLAGTSVKPPQLDEFFLDSEASLRESDFRELGWSEEEIWQSSAASK